MRKLLVAGSLALSLIAAPAFGQEDAGDEAATVKRDPKGVKGISPYREKLATGRTAFANGQNDGAIEAFDAAIAEDGAAMMAYLLKAQVQLAKGDLAGAMKTAETAKSKRGNEQTTAKLLFFMADLDERKAAPGSTEEKQSKLSEALKSTWDKVKEGWSAYAAYLTSHTTVPDYKATADERKKQVDARVKRDESFGAVAERIRKNQEARDKAAK